MSIVIIPLSTLIQLIATLTISQFTLILMQGVQKITKNNQKSIDILGQALKHGLRIYAAVKTFPILVYLIATFMIQCRHLIKILSITILVHMFDLITAHDYASYSFLRPNGLQCLCNVSEPSKFWQIAQDCECTSVINKTTNTLTGPIRASH